jgi:hypothetical protein
MRPQRVWENANGRHIAKASQAIREKATIDHLVKECYEAKTPKQGVHSP